MHPNLGTIGGRDRCSWNINLIVQFMVIAGEKFNYSPTRVLSKEAAEIDDISVVRENDHLYIIDDCQLQSLPHGQFPLPSSILALNYLLGQLYYPSRNTILEKKGHVPMGRFPRQRM
jgi:hypothetical protein